MRWCAYVQQTCQTTLLPSPGSRTVQSSEVPTPLTASTSTRSRTPSGRPRTDRARPSTPLTKKRKAVDTTQSAPPASKGNQARLLETTSRKCRRGSCDAAFTFLLVLFGGRSLLTRDQIRQRCHFRYWAATTATSQEVTRLIGLYSCGGPDDQCMKIVDPAIDYEDFVANAKTLWILGAIFMGVGFPGFFVRLAPTVAVP